VCWQKFGSLKAEASASGIEFVNVPNVRRLLFTVNANVKVFYTSLLYKCSKSESINT
jgi:hypothetical protein